MGIPVGMAQMISVFVSKELIFALDIFFFISFFKLNAEFRWKDMLSVRAVGASGAFFSLQCKPRRLSFKL